jgi:hypothetical protein
MRAELGTNTKAGLSLFPAKEHAMQYVWLVEKEHIIFIF